MDFITKTEFEALKIQVSQLENTYTALNSTYIENLQEIKNLTSDSVVAAECAKQSSFFARDAANNCYKIVLKHPTTELLSSVSLVLATAESSAKAAVEAAAAAAAASAGAARAAARQAEQASMQLAVQAAESSRQASRAATQAVKFSQEARDIVNDVNKKSKDKE